MKVGDLYMWTDFSTYKFIQIISINGDSLTYQYVEEGNMKGYISYFDKASFLAGSRKVTSLDRFLFGLEDE